MQNIDSAFLIKELQKGNKNAFELVFKKYYSPLCVYAKKYCLDDNTAEEIVSGFFFNFYKKRESIFVDISLRSYLFRSVRNASLNYMRNKSRMVLSEKIGNEDIDICASDTVHDTLIGKELKEIINKAIDSLPGQSRAIFLKSRFEGKKYKEIAEELNISINTVETQMSRALKKLRIELNDYINILLLIIG